MANPELVRSIDYILNRCTERDLDVVAAAVVKRRRQIALFGETGAIPDPQKLAKNLSAEINMSGAIDGMRKQIRDYAINIIKREAPELNDAQIAELTAAWIPEPGRSADRGGIPKKMLRSMIDQFIDFSLGRMEEEEDAALRAEMGPWPDKYWKSFPKVVRSLISDFLKGQISEKDFMSRMSIATSG